MKLDDLIFVVWRGYFIRSFCAGPWKVQGWEPVRSALNPYHVVGPEKVLLEEEIASDRHTFLAICLWNIENKREESGSGSGLTSPVVASLSSLNSSLALEALYPSRTQWS